MTTASTLSEKPHYAILDGLRGVAAVMVVAFHILEAHAPSRFEQWINHGYLAVDFFFLLSGFVIGYAYDDRWHKLSIGDFFKRRLIRLQPMVVVGMLIGAACFYFQDSVYWPNIHQVPVGEMLLIMVIGFTLIPVPPSMDIRGWIEMHPLNGPAWSLFFEYIANILYGLGFRKLPTVALTALVVVAGGLLIHLTVTGPQGDVIGGWSLDPAQLYIGFTRLMYPFFAGLLLFRVARLKKVSNAFVWSSLLTIVVLAFPRIGGSEDVWKNGLYDALSIIVIFPIIVYIGASGEVQSSAGKRICKFLGDISYPIYITHYPLIYIYTGWVQDHKHKFSDVYLVSLLVFISAVAVAYLSLKLYDEPVRNWLKKKFLTPKAL